MSIIGVSCVFGIYACYMTSSLVQEGIYLSGDPSKEGESFTYPMFLVFSLSLGCAITGLIYSMFNNNFNLKKALSVLYQHPKSDDDSNNLKISKNINKEIILDFFLTSLSYIGAMLASNYALMQVNYPTQVLVKSAKMVPIVVGNFLIFSRKYPWYDYMSVFAVSSALAMYNLSRIKSSPGQTITGLVLCCVSLLCDGLTGPRQDKINRKYVVTSTDHLVLLNLFALIPAGISFITIEGIEPILYCSKHPQVILLVCLYCLCNTVGQFFVFMALTNFGALYLALITTTRKFFTVFASVVYYRHSQTGTQWLAVAILFSSLVTQSICKHFDVKNKNNKIIKKK
eukprot:GHVR01057782.1.p1 GENE.GHVR01057782.1~~GHVR01057782.1.p1  ORF type:complete len:357 (+),score=55.85 GHVR01057782.1:47-1072(+)